MIFRPRLVHRTARTVSALQNHSDVGLVGRVSSWSVCDHSFCSMYRSQAIGPVGPDDKAFIARTSCQLSSYSFKRRCSHAIANGAGVLRPTLSLNEIRKRRKAQHGPRKRKLLTEADGELVTEIGKRDDTQPAQPRWREELEFKAHSIIMDSPHFSNPHAS